jgi:hypothetical protein
MAPGPSPPSHFVIDGTIADGNPVARLLWLELDARAFPVAPTVTELIPPKGTPVTVSWHEDKLGQMDRHPIRASGAKAPGHLRQQDRLASLGQLAAGIAHDFNNILQAIITSEELIIGHPGLPPGSFQRQSRGRAG